MIITKLQRKALYKIWARHGHTTAGQSYREFRRTVRQGYDCIMVEWCGMWLGIESDGYTHS